MPIYALGFYTDEALVWNIDSVEERAKPYIERMRAQQPEGPYRLVGFCGSALFAFEMARQLHDQGDQVPLLVLVEPGETGFAARRPARWRTYIIYYIIRLRHYLSRFARVPAKLWPKRVLAKMSTILRRRITEPLTIVPAPFDNSDFWKERPQLRTAFQTYRPDVYPGKAVLFLASQRVALHRDTDRPWRSVAGGGLDVHIIPGDHQSILREPDVQVLAQKIRTLYYENI